MSGTRECQNGTSRRVRTVFQRGPSHSPGGATGKPPPSPAGPAPMMAILWFFIAAGGSNLKFSSKAVSPMYCSTALMPTKSSTLFRLQPSSQGAGHTLPIIDGNGFASVERRKGVFLPGHVFRGGLDTTNDLQPSPDIFSRGATALAWRGSMDIGRTFVGGIFVKDVLLVIPPFKRTIFELPESQGIVVVGRDTHGQLRIKGENHSSGSRNAGKGRAGNAPGIGRYNRPGLEPRQPDRFPGSGMGNGGAII